MTRLASAVFLLALTACAGVSQPSYTASPCAISEASYECQVERYRNVSQ